MQRVLDLDLDFFVDGIATNRARSDGRLDPDEYPAWALADMLDFLRARCGLTGRLPGYVVQYHGDLFTRWRDAIDAGLLQAPFHVTHVDAHADLGIGDAGYMHLLTDLMFREPEDRRDPGKHLTDGNYLAFAIGCRWLSGLDYVYNRDNPDGWNPGDIHSYLMEGYRWDAPNVQLTALTSAQVERLWMLKQAVPAHVDPPVPFRQLGWAQFTASEPYDFICLARSPEFTPPTSDALFDEIRERFIDEHAPAP